MEGSGNLATTSFWPAYCPPTPRLFLSHPLRYLASLLCVSQQQSLRQHTAKHFQIQHARLQLSPLLQMFLKP